MGTDIVHYNRGLDLAASGETREALKELRLASRLNPSDSDALSEIGRLQIAEGRLGAAEAALDEALSRNPGHAGALNNQGVVDFLNGKYEQAEERFRASVGENPILAEAWFNLADTCEILGHREEEAEARLRFEELSDDN